MRRLKGYQIATYICRWIEPGDKQQEFRRECDHNLCINSTDERVVERNATPCKYSYKQLQPWLGIQLFC